MSKVLYAAVLVAAVAAISFTPGCKGSKKKDSSAACAACAACGCGDGCACAGGCEAGCEGGCEAGCGGGCACGGGCEAGCGGGCCGDGCEAGCGGCGCGGCGCGCGGGGEIDAKDAKQAVRLFGLYQKWTKTTEPFLSKQHMRHMVVNYVNGIAKDTFASGQGTYAANAAIVKEGWKDGERSVVWFMQKRKAGYDPDNGDWWYATVGVDGTVKNAGRVGACANCHTGADNDYVFGNPK